MVGAVVGALERGRSADQSREVRRHHTVVAATSCARMRFNRKCDSLRTTGNRGSVHKVMDSSCRPLYTAPESQQRQLVTLIFARTTGRPSGSLTTTNLPQDASCVGQSTVTPCSRPRPPRHRDRTRLWRKTIPAKRCSWRIWRSRVATRNGRSSSCRNPESKSPLLTS
jgi:hypothetical protein